MKKLILALAIALAFVAAPALAETTVDSQVSEINSLTEEINALQEQRRAKLSELIIKLKQGSRGDAVTALQTLLSLDSSVYPEGLVTGYFGPLTARAVKKFQAKNGLEQVGFVGPRTVEKLKKWADDNEITVDDDNSGPGSLNSGPGKGWGRRLCAIVPPGHMIAPGWLKKHGERPTLPPCQTLPPGIQAKLDDIDDDDDDDADDTDEEDTTDPDIDDLDESGVTETGAKVTWTTDEPTTDKIWYGTTSPVSTALAANMVDNTLDTEHSFTLTGLTADTQYYYVVESEDSSGNDTQSIERTFTTDN